ncbi:MAG: ETC complex I subunit [Rubricella sp.]
MAQTADLRPDCEVRAPQNTAETVSAEIITFPKQSVEKERSVKTPVSDSAPLALIHRPARSAMTSGPRAKAWRLDLQASRPQWLEPLMGWTSGDDPSRQVALTFSTKEAALDFAERQGWRAIVLPENRRAPVIKSYADNFRPDRRV